MKIFAAFLPLIAFPSCGPVAGNINPLDRAEFFEHRHDVIAPGFGQPVPVLTSSSGPQFTGLLPGNALNIPPQLGPPPAMPPNFGL